MTKRPHVLVVDDDRALRDLIESALEPRCQVHVTGDAISATDWLHDAPVDLLILDLVLPILDGEEFLRLLRADSVFARLPVLVITAYRPRAQALNGKVQGVLLKPFLLSELEEKACALLADPCSDLFPS